MIEMLLLLVILLGSGMWTKHTNTLYMRKLAKECKRKAQKEKDREWVEGVDYGEMVKDGEL